LPVAGAKTMRSSSVVGAFLNSIIPETVPLGSGASPQPLKKDRDAINKKDKLQSRLNN